MKSQKLLGIGVCLFILAAEAIAQPYPPAAPLIYETYLRGATRSLREGSYSNRTQDGQNISSPSWNGSPKTWSISDMTSWDTKFYDGKSFTDASVTAGSNILTSATAAFAVGDVGKTIEIINANIKSGVTGTPLTTTILSRISATQVTLATNALVTVSNTTIRYGFKPAYTEGHYTTYGYGNYEMNYRLLFPVGYNPNENYKYPIIIMMHGAGERGNCWGGTCLGNANNDYSTNGQYRNNDLNLTHGGQPHLEAIYNPTTGSNGKKAEDPTLPTHAFPGFVVFPQNDSGWNGANQYEQAYTIVDLLVSAYNIDPDRIYIHGLSNGAAAVWEVVRARPDLFAALLPMSATISHGAEIFTTEINKAVPIPAWIFQGGVDSNPTPNNTNQEVSKLKAAGAMPRYTIYPTVGHGTWGNAYAEPDFFSWMLKQNKRNITILFGDSTLCATDNSGVKLALSVGFLAYQWELDGATIPGATSSTYTATQPGTYRARFSRISATPSEAEWNTWSKPVVIRETPAITPTLTTVGTPHLPDINGGNSVRINGPTTKDLTKQWYVNGTLNTTNTNFPPSNLDTANYTLRTTAGVVTLKTIPLNACSSLASNAIYVTLTTPSTLVAPVSPQALAIAPGTVQLFWTDNTPNETGFEIYRSPTGGVGSWNFYKLVGQGTISYTDTGLTPNATYYYQLRAVNNTAVSPYTSTISVIASSDTQAPTAPQNLVNGTRTLTSIKLSWSASTDNVGVSSYNIYNNGTTLMASNVTATSYNVTGLTANSNYLFTVKALDLAGNVSQPSNQLVATTTFSGLNYTYSAVNVDDLQNASNNWNTPELTGTTTNFDISLRRQDDFFNFKFDGYIYITSGGNYKFRTTSDDGSALYLQGPFSTSNFATNRIVNNDGLHGNTTVTSVNINLPANTAQQITTIFFEKTGGQSLLVEYTGPDTGGGNNWVAIPNGVLNSGPAPTITPPSAPTGLSATSGGMSSINLSWNSMAGANYYEVYRSPDNVTFTLIASAATNAYSDTGLTPSTLYYYKLKSVSNTTGSSGFSSTVNATTAADTQAPTIPTGVSILSFNYTNAGFQWTASTDNVSVAGYKIYANGTLLGTSATTTYYTSALLPATAYSITVAAYDNGTPSNVSAQSTGASFTTPGPAIFYSKPSSDLSQLNSWSSTTDGSGPPPPNFNYNGQYFIIQNTQTLTNPLTVDGNVSRIVVNDGVSVTISSALSGIFNIGNNASVAFNYDYQPVFETIAPNSTVTFNTYSSIPLATYGNLVLNGTGLKTIAAGTLEVAGNLTLANGVGIKGISSNGSTVKVGGDLITGASVGTVSADNRVTLQFANAGTHNMTVSSNQLFYKITTGAGATVVFNNTSGSAKSLGLGSLNGGGIDLANGSTLVLGNNTLSLTDKSTVNLSNATGEISITNGNISFTTTATTANNFYFTTGSNKVQNFTLQTSGTTIIQKVVEIYDGLKINSGVLNAAGNVIIKSSATASAAIQQIVTGSITGNVSAERYMSAKKVYRYISSPVAGVKVADWQNYFPITGAFTGTSTGPGITANPSMFYYTEPNFIAYPTTNNQATIQVGRGYAAFIRDAVNPITMISTGVPNQGTIAFTLTGGTVASNTGWNLIGNPYASDIVWGNTGWTSANISNIISIRENFPNGSFGWRYWDRTGSGSGTLVGGKIPAGQAFWVQATTLAPSLSLSESAKTAQSASNNTSFFRTNSAADANSNLFSIKLDNGTYQDYAYVRLSDEGSDLYDKNRDGAKRANSYFNLSTSTTTIDSVNLAVNEISNSFCEKIVKINLANVVAGNYTLSFENLENFGLANVQLIDAFLTTTTPLNPANSQFTITVTSAVASYKNRLSLKLTRPDINSNNVISSNKNIYCRSDENAIVTIQNSQVGANYEAISPTSDVLSQKVVGNGQAVQLLIPIKDLAESQTIQVRSGFTGCSTVNLTSHKTIAISELPTVIPPADLKGCINGVVDISATGTGSKFEWFNENDNQILSATGSSLQVSIVHPITSFRVTSLNDKGCKSEPKNFLVRADSVYTDNALLFDKDIYCRTEQIATLLIPNSQIGVTYEVTGLSNQVLGTGETLQFQIPITDLPNGQVFKVSANLGNCSTSLSNTKTISIAEIPTLNAPTEITGCKGETVTATVTGTGKTYVWVNQNTNTTLDVATSSIQIPLKNSSDSFNVTAIGDGGCQSETKTLLLKADSLATPVIALSPDSVFVTNGIADVQWLLDENIIPGAHEKRYKPLQSGSYSVQTKTEYCVRESSSIKYTAPIDHVVTGIGDSPIESFTLSLYPNPLTRGNSLTVKGNTPVQLKLQITDLLGKDLIIKSLSPKDFKNGVTLETDFPDGIYIVRVKQDGKSLHEKLIIHQ